MPNETVNAKPIVPLPDQSFSSRISTDLNMLQEVERAFAAYAVAFAKKQGRYQNPPPGAKAGFFPHGVGSGKNNTWLNARPGPASASEAMAEFPSPVSGAVTIVETSEPIVLTKQLSSSVKGRLVSVTGDNHLLVLGDIVTIQGKITCAGKHIVIVARELRTQALPSQGAELNVDGAAPPAAPLEKAQAAGGDSGANAVLHAQDHVFLTYDAQRATAGQPGHDGDDGRPGDPGNAAGDIYIFCHGMAERAALTLSAAGGAGQGGQAGQPGGPGGKGGDGKVLNMGRVGRNQCAFVARGRPGGPGGLGGVGGAGGRGGDAGHCVLIVNKNLSESAAGSLKSVVTPGAAGARGRRGNEGSLGPSGVQYSENRADHHGRPVRVIDADVGFGHALRTDTRQERPDPPPARWGRRLSVLVADVASVPEDVDHPVNELRGPAPLTYLQKLLETARLRYLEWDAFRFARDPRVGEVKAELLDRCDFLLAARRMISKFMSTADATVASSIGDTTTGLVNNLAHELDYFGHFRDYVPLGSPSFFLEAFQASLALLEKREAMMHAYATALSAQQSVNEKTVADLRGINDEAAALATEQSTLMNVLTSIVRHDLPAADVAIAAARNELRPTLIDLATWVDKCFGLTPDDFLNCVFNMAFIGSPFEANPRPGGAGTVLSKHGLFTAATTITSQTGTLIQKAINTLPNDEGQPVNRKLLLRRVDRFTGSLDNLKEAWATVTRARHNPGDPDAIKLDDPDSYRLLVAQKDFEELLDQFSSHKEVQAAIDALGHYVAAVQKRNAILGDYNALVADYLRAAGDRRSLDSRRAGVEEARVKLQPDLAYEAAYVADLYNRSREDCVERCYLALRSHGFWSLEPEPLADDRRRNRGGPTLYEALRLGTPNEMNALVLSKAAESLCTARTGVITKAFGDQVQNFPDRENDFTGSGTYLILTPAAHPKAFSELKAHGVALFRLEELREKTSPHDNPFALYRNVRLRRVRPWIRGFEATGDLCHVDIRHLGQEFVLGPEGTWLSFTHEPVRCSFEYLWKKVVWEDHRVLKPAEVLREEGHDGTLTIPKEYAGSEYVPLIGPFATWEISLRANDGVQWDKIMAIHLDFHGFFQNR